MENERLYALLISAVSMLIDEEISAVDIKEGLGMTQEEWEQLMENF